MDLDLEKWYQERDESADTMYRCTEGWVRRLKKRIRKRLQKDPSLRVFKLPRLPKQLVAHGTEYGWKEFDNFLISTHVNMEKEFGGKWDYNWDYLPGKDVYFYYKVLTPEQEKAKKERLRQFEREYNLTQWLKSLCEEVKAKGPMVIAIPPEIRSNYSEKEIREALVDRLPDWLSEGPMVIALSTDRETLVRRPDLEDPCEWRVVEEHGEFKVEAVKEQPKPEEKWLPSFRLW